MVVKRKFEELRGNSGSLGSSGVLKEFEKSRGNSGSFEGIRGVRGSLGSFEGIWKFEGPSKSNRRVFSGSS